MGGSVEAIRPFTPKTRPKVCLTSSDQLRQHDVQGEVLAITFFTARVEAVPLPSFACAILRQSMSSETSRVEAFSDGVFAIAITLLILDVHVPTSSQGSLGHALGRQWPTYVAFLISFAFIGIMWVNHHRLFNHIHRTDNGLMFLNLLLLLGVTVVPFPTALIAAHYYAVRGDLVDSATHESAEAISKQYAVGPISYLICLGLTWVSVPASLGLNIALALFFAMPPRTKHGNRAREMHIAAK